MTSIDDVITQGLMPERILYPTKSVTYKRCRDGLSDRKKVQRFFGIKASKKEWREKKAEILMLCAQYKKLEEDLLSYMARKLADDVDKKIIESLTKDSKSC